MNELSFPHTIEYKVLSFPGKRIVYDVRNAGIFVAHRLMLDILSMGKKLEKQAITQLLRRRYSLQCITDAFEEIESHRSQGFLLSADEVRHLDPCEDDSILFSPVLILTTRCNLRCPYCFMQGKSCSEEDMSPTTGRQAVDFFVQQLRSNGKGSGTISFFGGEPLLNYSTLVQTIKYALERSRELALDLAFTVTTNGTLFSAEMADFFKGLDISVRIGIDGPEIFENLLRPSADGTDTYRRVKDNIGRFKEALQDRVTLRATCTAKSIRPLTIYEALEAYGIEEIGMGMCFFSPVDGFAVKSKEEIDRYLEEITEIKRRQIERGYFSPVISDHLRRIVLRKQRIFACGYGRTTVTVDPSGDIYPCYRFLGRHEFRMGTVLSGIDRHIQKRYYNTVDMRIRCRRCWIRYHCGGGCAGDHFDMAGDIEKPSRLYCYYQKEAFRRMLAVYDSLSPVARERRIEKILDLRRQG
jgi:uncharacterized protein